MKIILYFWWLIKRTAQGHSQYLTTKLLTKLINKVSREPKNHTNIVTPWRFFFFSHFYNKKGDGIIMIDNYNNLNTITINEML